MELPIKKVVFDELDPQEGLTLVSLVKDPAIGYTAIKFSECKDIKLAVSSEEKRIIFTPVLIPNQKIYRNINGEEFDLIFEADVIERVAIQFQRHHLSTKSDTNHSENLIPGVTFYETFLLSDRARVVNEQFKDLPMGTWFLTGKVDNDVIWQKIKAGEITGVSIDGVFKTMNVKAATHIKYTEVKVANDNSLFIDGQVAVGNNVYYNKPETVMINGMKSELKRLVWENQITINDGTTLMLTDGKIIEVVPAPPGFTDAEMQVIAQQILGN